MHSTKLAKTLKALQAAMLALALVTVSFPMSARATVVAPVCTPNADQVLVSDATTKQGDDNASVLVSPINVAWTVTIAGASWIWGEQLSDQDAAAGSTETFSKDFTITGNPLDSTLQIATDNTYSAITVNGHVLPDVGGDNFGAGLPATVAIPAAYLLTGANTFSVTVTNGAGGDHLSNPAGLLYSLTIKSETCPPPPPTDVCSNLDGVQATVPQGYTGNEDHICTKIPVQNGSCVAPTGTESAISFGASAEETLQGVLDDNSYGLNATTDQTNTQTWNGTNNTVSFTVKNVKKLSAYTHVFGYYTGGNLATFTPVFYDGSAAAPAPYAAVPLLAVGATSATFSVPSVTAPGVGFAVKTYNGSTLVGTWATQKSANTDSNNHTVVYNPSTDTYVIGFDDQTGQPNQIDRDYNDIVTEVKVTGCLNPHDITIVAAKIVCTNEADLPNWGNGGPDITATTAAAWVASHESCHLESGWHFEVANQTGGDAGRAFVGSAGAPYSDFGPTVGGYATTTVSDIGVSEFHLREVLKDGYIPFTYDQTEGHSNNNDNVSAEFYCSDDVLNYDNWDYIRNPGQKEGATQYCVAWNVAKVVPQCTTEGNILSNGGFETPSVSGAWNIVPSGTAGLGWLVSWINPSGAPAIANAEFQKTVAGWLPHGGSQYAELDSDYFGPSNSGQGHPAVSMSQTVATTPGVKYTFSFWFSPRPDQGASENKADATANGVVIGSTAAVAGNGTLTQWTQYSFDFTATTTSTTFALRDAAGNPNDSLGTFVDDASVSCIADETPTCPEGQHFNVDHICVPDVQECSVDAATTLLSGDQGEGELITAALGNGAAKLVASPNGAWFAPGIGDGKWIWKDTFTSNTDAQNPTSQTFERNFQITGTPLDATLTIAADNTYDVKVNGHQECSNLTEFNYGATVNCTIPAADMVTGWNSLDITVTNKPIEGSTGANNPAGLSYKLVTHDNQCTVPDPTTGTLVIVKETTGGDGSFDFDVTGDDSSTDADVDTTEGSGSTEVSLPEGEYNVTETGASGWTLNSVSCVYDEESVGNSIPNGEAISLKAGDTVTCTFHNTKTGDSTPTPTNGTTGSGGGKKKSSGEVLGASTCSPLLTDYLKFGWKNNEDQVKKLQQFLNDHLGLSLPVSGFFGPATFNAVKQFQTQYGNDVLIPWVGLPASGISGQNTPTGYVYQTTRWKINNIWCPGSESFPTVLN